MAGHLRLLEAGELMTIKQKIWRQHWSLRNDLRRQCKRGGAATVAAVRLDRGVTAGCSRWLQSSGRARFSPLSPQADLLRIVRHGDQHGLRVALVC